MVKMTDSELTILSFVMDGLNYSYAMEKNIEKKHIRDYFDLSFSSIYFLINTLEKKGFIESYSSFCKKGIIKKGVNITDDGKNEFFNSLNEKFSAKPLVSHPLDYAIFNAHHLSGDQLKIGFTKYIKEVTNLYKYYVQKKEELLDGEVQLSIGEELVIEHFLSRLQNEISWAIKTKEYLSNIENLDERLQKDKNSIKELFRGLILNQ